MVKLVFLAVLLVVAASVNAEDPIIGMPTPSKLLWAGGYNHDSEFSLLSDPAGDARRELYCLYYSSANYQTDIKMRLVLSDVENSECDRLIVRVGSIKLDPENDFEMSFTNETVRQMIVPGLRQLQMANPKLKLFLDTEFNITRSFFNLVREKSADYSTVARNIMKFLAGGRVNGIMIRTDDKLNVEKSEIESFFSALAVEAKLWNMLILLHLAPFENNIAPAFKYVDRIFVNDHSPSILNDTILRHPTALRRRINEKGMEIMLNKDFEMDYMIRVLGAPRNKLIMILNAGGYDFELKDSRRNWIGASSKGEELEYLPIAEICERQKDENWKLSYDNAQRVPYMYNSSMWTAYDNKESLRHKVNMVKHKKMRGVFFDSLDFDDVTGDFCEDMPFATVKFIQRILFQSHMMD